MMKAIYPFSSSDPGTLKCDSGDLLCSMGLDGSGQWVKACDDKGMIGFLPASYMEHCTWSDTKNVLRFVDEVIESIHLHAAQCGKYTVLQKEHLRVLLEFRKQTATQHASVILETQKHKTRSEHQSGDEIKVTSSADSQNELKQTTDRSTSTTDLVNQGGTFDTSPSEPYRSNTNMSVSPQNSSSAYLAAHLTDLLRSSTGLSHQKCQVGLATVLEALLAHNVTQDCLASIAKVFSKDDIVGLDDSQDIVEMTEIFGEIAACKDDSQQRSWYLHDDEAVISERLTRLLFILTTGNTVHLAAMISRDKDYLYNTVLYYQMESRHRLRNILLQLFAAICHMDDKFVSFLLSSVLPLEVTRDLMANQDQERTALNVTLLTLLFSTAEPLPVNYHEILNAAFVDFLLDRIEWEQHEEAIDRYLGVVFSFNQHFTDPLHNLVLSCLSARTQVTTLMERFLSLFNRHDDPVKVAHGRQKMNSVMKFALDLFARQDTAQLLYTNDVKVLVDIVVRHLLDLSPSDKERTDYLMLMKSIVSNTEYLEHEHRKTDLVIALNQIEFTEEEDREVGRRQQTDIHIVRLIRQLLQNQHLGDVQSKDSV